MVYNVYRGDIMRGIRNSVKAIIIRENRILFTKNLDKNGYFYLLPGGEQEKFETMSEAVIRKCREEISAEIEVGDIRLIREYIGKNHEFYDADFELHQIEYMFVCCLKENSKAKNGSLPGNKQVGIEWIKIDELKEYRIYPGILKELIKNDGVISGEVYLGDIN